MKIGILNLPFDNNYGGNLQRYALMTVLRGMGHEPVHLNCQFGLGTVKSRVHDGLRKGVQSILAALDEHGMDAGLNDRFGSPTLQAERFYERYITHTPAIYRYEDLPRYAGFDAYVVGSDQVWRRYYIRNHPGQFFFDFLPEGKKRIAYAASLGVDKDDYSREECEMLKPLYNKFSAVSVRETNLVDILEQRGWNSPKAVVTLDPTLLADKREYERIIAENKTKKPQGGLYLYTLDMVEAAERLIAERGLDRHHTCYRATINTRIPCSIPQWLRNIADAACVVTDSYHGLLFSIIFNKPYYLLENRERGVARFQSIFALLGLDADGLSLTASDWQRVNQRIAELRMTSIDFLQMSLQ